jgi:hypothetical protein
VGREISRAQALLRAEGLLTDLINAPEAKNNIRPVEWCK